MTGCSQFDMEPSTNGSRSLQTGGVGSLSRDSKQQYIKKWDWTKKLKTEQNIVLQLLGAVWVPVCGSGVLPCSHRVKVMWIGKPARRQAAKQAAYHRDLAFQSPPMSPRRYVYTSPAPKTTLYKPGRRKRANDEGLLKIRRAVWYNPQIIGKWQFQR